MAQKNRFKPTPKYTAIAVAIVIALLISIVLLVSWVLTRGVEDTTLEAPSSEQQVENMPSANPNIERGPSGSDNTRTIPTDGSAP